MADQLLGARRLVVPGALREYNARITEARQQKEAAVDGGDFEHAGRVRDTEKRLLTEREQLVTTWIAEVDPVLLVNEPDRLYQETEHLWGLLANPGRTGDEDAADASG